MLVFVTEDIGLHCPDSGGWDLLKYRVAMNTPGKIPFLCLFSGYEAASASKLRRAEASIIGLTSQTYAFWEAFMTCIVFCRITFASAKFPFLMVPERSFQHEEHDRSSGEMKLPTAYISGPESSTGPSSLSQWMCDL